MSKNEGDYWLSINGCAPVSVENQKPDGSEPSGFCVYIYLQWSALFVSGALQFLQLSEHIGVVFTYGMPRFHLIRASEALLTLFYRLADIGYYNRISRNVFNCPFHMIYAFSD